MGTASCTVPVPIGSPLIVCHVHRRSDGRAARHAHGVCLPLCTITYWIGSRLVRICAKDWAAVVSLVSPEPDMIQKRGRLERRSSANVDGSFSAISAEPARPSELRRAVEVRHGRRSCDGRRRTCGYACGPRRRGRRGATVLSVARAPKSVPLATGSISTLSWGWSPYTLLVAW